MNGTLNPSSAASAYGKGSDENFDPVESPKALMPVGDSGPHGSKVISNCGFDLPVTSLHFRKGSEELQGQLVQPIYAKQRVTRCSTPNANPYAHLCALIQKLCSSERPRRRYSIEDVA